MGVAAALLALIAICCLSICVALVALYRKRSAEIGAVAFGPGREATWLLALTLRAVHEGRAGALQPISSMTGGRRPKPASIRVPASAVMAVPCRPIMRRP